MSINHGFEHAINGPKRPQIVIVGNGLERLSGQSSWSTFLNDIAAPHCMKLTERDKKKIPFPLVYELLSTPFPVPAHISRQMINEQEKRLSDALNKMNNGSNAVLDKIPELGADHIFTTNYAYCIETAFTGKDFSNSNVQKNNRRHCTSSKEKEYRIHSCYVVQNKNTTDKKDVGIWHIHGETSAAKGVVLGSDRYGRNLERIVRAANQCNYGTVTSSNTMEFTSWPELFLFGDLYIIGLGYEFCDNDLWWLLRRKQREKYSDSHVYFYEFRDKSSLKQKMLISHGVVIPKIGTKKPERSRDYEHYYKLALEDIKKRIKRHK